MSKTYIGIDNGITGSIGIISGGEYYLFKVPTKSGQDYTKKKQNVTRIDCSEFTNLLYEYTENAADRKAVLERPFVNPRGFQATASALRCMEAEMIILEMLGIPFEFIDSRAWQKEFLPTGARGPELKTTSRDKGIQLFPLYEEEIRKMKDADGLLIAEWARRHNL
jgi:hypothetical protein